MGDKKKFKLLEREPEGKVDKTPKEKKPEVKDQIPGGKADNRPDSDFNQVQLKKGVKVEIEHTKDKNLAREIAKDHLSEFPDYYTRLEEMEKKAEEDWKIRRKLMKLFEKHPNPDDKLIHEFADKEGIKSDKLEEHIYAITTYLMKKKKKTASVIATLETKGHFGLANEIRTLEGDSI